MTNGLHSHYCPRHKAHIECAQITHCRKAKTALCADCVYDDLMAKKEKQAVNKEPIYHAYGGGTFGED